MHRRATKKRHVGFLVGACAAAVAIAGVLWGVVFLRGPACGVEGRVWPADEPPEDCPLADGFDFPVSPPDGGHFVVWKGWRVDGHLGEDFDGGAGDSDLGEPVCAVAVGRVSVAEDVGGSWGRIVRIVHHYRDERGAVRGVESLYSHLARIDVTAGHVVRRGDQIGTLGNCDGVYQAHLHFEVRGRVRLPLGPGYAEDARGWLPPSEFIRQHRPHLQDR